MWGCLLPLALLVFSQANGPPPVRFAYSDYFLKHIAVESQGAYYVVHFNVRVRGCDGKRVYARLRCVEEANHTSFDEQAATKLVRIENTDEKWSFYFRTPRYGAQRNVNVKYQIEVGVYEPEKLNEYRLVDSFAWRMRNGQMDVGTLDAPVLVTVPWREAEVVGTEFRVKTGYRTRRGVGDLQYGIATYGRPMPNSIPGERSARRLEP